MRFMNEYSKAIFDCACLKEIERKAIIDIINSLRHPYAEYICSRIERDMVYSNDRFYRAQVLDAFIKWIIAIVDKIADAEPIFTSDDETPDEIRTNSRLHALKAVIDCNNEAIEPFITRLYNEIYRD